MIDPKRNKNNLADRINDDDLNDEEVKKLSESLNLRNKIRNIIVLIIVLTILILIIVWLISLKASKSRSYSDLENIMSEAAEKYYGDNKELLPKKNKDISEVSISKLINNKYLKELDKYGDNMALCSGKVVIENNDGQYVYIPYLDCGEKYKTKELYREIIKDDHIVTSGAGLYYMNNEYVFRGDNVDNYVSLDDKLWRIVKVTQNGEVELIYNTSYDTATYWDNRYNSTTKSTDGYNDYSISRMKEQLNEFYDTFKESDDEDNLLSKDTMKHLTSYNLCYGKRSVEQNVNNNSLECSKTESTRLGLLTVSDYINASLDAGCSKASDLSCQNYNYLASTKDAWWLLTGKAENDYQVYYVTRGGVIKYSLASDYYSIRPVIQLNNKTMFESGKGTKNKPYKIK